MTDQEELLYVSAALREQAETLTRLAWALERRDETGARVALDKLYTRLDTYEARWERVRYRFAAVRHGMEPIEFATRLHSSAHAAIQSVVESLYWDGEDFVKAYWSHVRRSMPMPGDRVGESPTSTDTLGRLEDACTTDDMWYLLRCLGQCDPSFASNLSLAEYERELTRVVCAAEAELGVALPQANGSQPSAEPKRTVTAEAPTASAAVPDHPGEWSIPASKTRIGKLLAATGLTDKTYRAAFERLREDHPDAVRQIEDRKWSVRLDRMESVFPEMVEKLRRRLKQ